MSIIAVVTYGIIMVNMIIYTQIIAYILNYPQNPHYLKIIVDKSVFLRIYSSKLLLNISLPNI